MRLWIALAAVMALWLASWPIKSAANDARNDWPDAEEYVVLPPPSLAPLLAMGHRELAADLTWVRMLGYYADEVGRTDASYLEAFIDNIVALDPRFERIYLWAGRATTFKGASATQTEFATSVRYLELGIEQFPDNWETHYLLGLRYWSDLKSNEPDTHRSYRERGANHLETAMRLPGAPANLPTLLANMRTELGQRNRAIRDLREMILTTDNDRARERMLAHYGYLLDSLDATEELRRAAVAFNAEWIEAMPYTDSSMYVLLGPAPSPVVDFDELATDRDLFGSQDGDFAALEDPSAPSALRTNDATSPHPSP